MTDISKSGKSTTLSSFYILGVTFTVNPSLLAPPEELSPTQEYLLKSASSFTVIFVMCSVAITLSPEKKNKQTNKIKIITISEACGQSPPAELHC